MPMIRWLLVALLRCGASQLYNATPAKLITCTGAVEVTECLTLAQYDAIVTAVRGALESLPSTCTASECPQADWAGCILRMAGHDFMDYADGQGGSDACTDMEDPENAGLSACLVSGEHGKSLQEVYQGFCQQVSLADFLVISAEAVIASTRQRQETAKPGSASLDLRGGFRFGRRTAAACDFARGRLPDPERGCAAVEETFLQRMGLDWSKGAALMGVHTLGRAKVENSGYHGWWSDPENSRRFNHNYYVSLLAKGWTPERGISGNAQKNQWERSDIGRDTSLDGHEMMLNTDLCLAFADGPNGPALAQDHDCCAWLHSNIITGAVSNNDGEYCGGARQRGPAERDQCCGPPRRDCGRRDDPSGPAQAAVRSFADDEGVWLQSFAEAWKIATENGHQELHSLGQCTSTSTTGASGVSSTVGSSTASTSTGASGVSSTLESSTSTTGSEAVSSTVGSSTSSTSRRNDSDELQF